MLDGFLGRKLHAYTQKLAMKIGKIVNFSVSSTQTLSHCSHYVITYWRHRLLSKLSIFQETIMKELSLWLYAIPEYSTFLMEDFNRDLHRRFPLENSP